MRVVGFDARPIRRQVTKDDKREPDFKANLGIAVTISDYELFVKKYEQIVENLFAKYAVPPQPGLRKASELVEIFYAIGIDLIPELATSIIQEVDYIDIIYSFFAKEIGPDGKPARVKVYWATPEWKIYSKAEFVDLLEGQFPALCCYAYLQKNRTEIPGSTYYVDFCPALYPSTAIQTVLQNTHTRLLYKGDQVNHAINAADILCRYIDNECIRHAAFLNQHLVQKLGLPHNKFETTFIGEKWIKQINPSRNIKLSANHKAPHPLFVFFTSPSNPFGKETRSVVENSPLYRRALQEAAKIGGCVKLFEAEDQTILNENDFLVVHDTESKAKADALAALGIKSKIVNQNYFQN